MALSLREDEDECLVNLPGKVLAIAYGNMSAWQYEKKTVSIDMISERHVHNV